jgi:hypothetical protein
VGWRTGKFGQVPSAIGLLLVLSRKALFLRLVAVQHKARNAALQQIAFRHPAGFSQGLAYQRARFGFADLSARTNA